MTRAAVIRNVVPPAAALIGTVVILLWWMMDPGRTLEIRAPSADESGAGSLTGPAGPWAGKLIKGAGVPANLTGVWPNFRGPRHDNLCTDPTPLLKSFPASGPKQLWKLEVGEGYAAPVLWKGRAYLLDYDVAARADALRCLSLTDGAEIWRYTYPSKIKRNHGFSRTIPTVVGQSVISLGPKYNVLCVDALEGTLRWQMDLMREYHPQVPEWYAGQCPLVDGDRLILGVGGDCLIAAIDINTGQAVWKTPNPNHWKMTHSSLAVMEFAGKKMYLYCAGGGLVAVDAATGAILWDYPDWKISFATIPSPLPVGDGRIFLSGGYNAGSAMLQLKEKDGQIKPELLFRLKQSVFGAIQQTPILYKEHIFGIRPDGQLVCLSLDGKIVWESGPAHQFGNGPLLIAQDTIFLLSDSGTLTLAEASVEGYKPLSEASVLDGGDAWGPLALADGRLMVRDMTHVVCLEVGK